MKEKAKYKLADLPLKLGEAFLAAVKEADAQYNRPDGIYAPESYTWHSPERAPNTDKPICAICLAGALMAQAGVPKDEWSVPHGFDDGRQKVHFGLNDRHRLQAIEDIRHGDFGMAYINWYGYPMPEDLNVKLQKVIPYSARADIEWSGMKEWREALPLLNQRGRDLARCGV